MLKITTLFRACTFSAILFSTLAPPVFADSAEIMVGFSPEGSAQTLVLDTINSAQSSIRMMAYSFTDPDIMKALANASKRGVDIRIVIDENGNTSAASREAIKTMRLFNIPLRIDGDFAIQHDKVIIVDETTVQTGSYNYSRSAAKKNSENVIVLSNVPDIASQYLEHWQDRWDRGHE
ncbi:phospholipase D family protein [Salmonella enterica subsp. enterica serovar Legon]|nr:phospholipase D family protein [Salmonella enterica subsp. enterica serovar Legon]EDW9825420.1 phospholipase D family protein [Salmonella enterica]EDZ3589472.1 DUF1669 domain-containing protein [Salmonella enterica subsp. enterica serovar Wagenia]